MQVELVRAWPHRSDRVRVELASTARVSDALAAAGWALDDVFVGLAVFGVAARLDDRLHAGDRVELLRALQLDPKQARRLRAERSRQRQR